MKRIDMFGQPLDEPTEADLKKCAARVRKLGFAKGHDWTDARDGSNFRYCTRCHEPGWEMPTTTKETASA